MTCETCPLPAAALGAENPLPPIDVRADLHAELAGENIPDEDRAGLRWGLPRSPLPYRLQDGYTRARTVRAFKSVVLENEHLRATFLPEVGGRLWSLVHRPSGRELLARNSVFQPCNLAIRNAWVSGGVEWNFGWTGHWPLTCEPLFAAEFRLPDGTPGLRMWEWERLRQLPFQIDAWLPHGSRALFVRVAIHNPTPDTVPVYWWSNTAVEVRPGTRVVTPADSALTHAYGGGLALAGVPRDGDLDTTRVADHTRSRDYFYRLPAGVRPWIAAVDGAGWGLFQTSTARLRGRKLFTWGSTRGGERWQRFLGTPDYIEIQAGLARTQSHHLPLEAGATWNWVEAYGACEADAAAVHGADWSRAQAAVSAVIESAAPAADLDAALSSSAGWASQPAGALIQRGSGWGALEELRRRRQGGAALGLGGIWFPADALSGDQHAWRALLEEGRFPECEPSDGPGCYMVQAAWRDLLGASLSRPGGRHWAALFHYGVALWNEARTTEAEAAWLESLQCRDNPWAAHALGIAAQQAGRAGEAVDWLGRAHAAQPAATELAIPFLQALVAGQAFVQARDAIRALPDAARQHPRVRVIEGRALLGTGELDALEAWLADPPVVADLREGETQLSDLWFALHEARATLALGVPPDEAQRERIRAEHPVPTALDFRMRV